MKTIKGLEHVTYNNRHLRSFSPGKGKAQGELINVYKHMLRLTKKMEMDFSQCHPMKRDKEKDKLKYSNFHLNIRHVVRSRHILSVLSMGVPLGHYLKDLIRKILFNFPYFCTDVNILYQTVL